MGPTGRGSQRPRPFRRQFPGRPALPSGQNPPAGSSRGNCCLGSRHPATWVPGMRLGGRAGAYLGSVCSGRSRRGCTLLGTGEGAALGGGLAGRGGRNARARGTEGISSPASAPAEQRLGSTREQYRTAGSQVLPQTCCSESAL